MPKRRGDEARQQDDGMDEADDPVDDGRAGRDRGRRPLLRRKCRPAQKRLWAAVRRLGLPARDSVS
jgi:hypothetical protein